jgi:hypothetical protein
MGKKNFKRAGKMPALQGKRRRRKERGRDGCQALKSAPYAA